MRNKNKTHSGAGKRFKLTSTGKIKRSHAGVSHLLTKKNSKRRRKLRKSVVMANSDARQIRKIIGNRA